MVRTVIVIKWSYIALGHELTVERGLTCFATAVDPKVVRHELAGVVPDSPETVGYHDD